MHAHTHTYTHIHTHTHRNKIRSKYTCMSNIKQQMDLCAYTHTHTHTHIGYRILSSIAQGVAIAVVFVCFIVRKCLLTAEGALRESGASFSSLCC